MKVEIGKLVLALVAGAAVGSFYFGGLWLTVRRVPTAHRPMLMAFGSFVIRIAVAAAVMIFLARIHWQLLVAFVVGFIIIRVVLVRVLGRDGEVGAARPLEGTLCLNSVPHGVGV